MDNRQVPLRAMRVLSGLDADIIALQEATFSLEKGGHLDEEFFARHTGMEVALGPTCFRKSFHFGNVLLSRLPLSLVRKIDLSTHPYEPRGAIDALADIGGRHLRVLSAHLGLKVPERNFQAGLIAGALASGHAEPVVIMGDLNDWLPGCLSLRKLLALFHHGKSPRSFPSLLPLFSLDRILVKPSGSLKKLKAHRSPDIVLASDHLPVTADIAL
jgi:endonuclease/exonuclease/phosphatase family metal-dependent hydrolase